MTHEEAVQALLALERAELLRVQHQEEERAASESLAAAYHWEQLQHALEQWLSEPVLACANLEKPDDWSSQTKEYVFSLALPDHAEITCRFTCINGAWGAVPWPACANDASDPSEHPYWAVSGYGTHYYHRLAPALLKASEIGVREIPF